MKDNLSVSIVQGLGFRLYIYYVVTIIYSLYQIVYAVRWPRFQFVEDLSSIYRFGLPFLHYGIIGTC